MFSMVEVKARNKAMGLHWFDKDTVKFFNGKIHSDATNRSGYFVHSIQFIDGGFSLPRKYLVACFDYDSGSIDTITLAHKSGFSTLADARKFMEKISCESFELTADELELVDEFWLAEIKK